MKLEIILGLLLAIAIAYFIFQKKSKPEEKKKKDDEPVSKKGKIYGSMACGYTVKQIEKYPDFDFVDCSAGGCPTFVTAYPTTEFPDGTKTVGYQ